MLGYSLSAIAPTSKDSHVRQNMLGAASTGLTAMINPDRLLSGLNVVTVFSLARLVHQYDTATDGSVNTEYSTRQTLSLSYDWPSGFTLVGVFTHGNAMTYQNNIRESFEHYEEVEYQISKTFGVALGHSNAGSILKANGVDSNVALVDDNTSMVYASLTVVF